MKIKLRFTKIKYLKTETNGIATLSVLGKVWDKKDLCSVLSGLEDVSTLVDKVKTITGFFSIVYQKEDDLFASVDHVRSHPLFYGRKDGWFCLSDEAMWVKEQVGDTIVDPVARDEFQLAGYVTGRDTLFPNVKQLQAGECLTVIGGKVSLYRYYTFEHTEPQRYDETELLNNLDKVSKDAIARLIEYAGGRQIVIPLSGGYDSRLIATLLKKARYPNVFCFTYGINGNTDASCSKIVAKALGLPWYFVEYTRELWKEAVSTEDYKRYKNFAFNFVSLSHAQDWLAVKKLRKNSVVAEDALFVPGHSGDMVAGSHLPMFVFDNIEGVRTKSDVLSELLRKHYCLAPYSKIKTGKEFFERRVLESLRDRTIDSTKDFANACESWNWQERQAKFICNSIRVYEYFGYDWWMPLWDRPFVKFFEDLPLQLRNHDWYKTYVSLIYGEVSGVQSQEFSNLMSLKVTLSSAKRVLTKTKMAKNIKNKIYMLLPQKSANAIEGRYDAKIYNRMLRQGYKGNGINAYFVLNDMQNSTFQRNQ